MHWLVNRSTVHYWYRQLSELPWLFGFAYYFHYSFWISFGTYYFSYSMRMSLPTLTKSFCHTVQTCDKSMIIWLREYCSDDARLVTRMLARHCLQLPLDPRTIHTEQSYIGRYTPGGSRSRLRECPRWPANHAHSGATSQPRSKFHLAPSCRAVIDVHHSYILTLLTNWL